MVGVTFLVVDDDPLMHRMLVPRLRLVEVPMGVADALAAETPEAALALLDKASDGPLVVLSDFNLRASVNGVQLLAEARRRRPDALRILFSGYSAEQLGQLEPADAFDAFVEKHLLLEDMVRDILLTVQPWLAARAAER